MSFHVTHYAVRWELQFQSKLFKQLLHAGDFDNVCTNRFGSEIGKAISCKLCVSIRQLSKYSMYFECIFIMIRIFRSLITS